VIAKAEGEASRFLQTLTEYEKAPEVTRKRLYLETMEYVLANTSKVIMQVKEGNNLMYIPLDRLMETRTGYMPSTDESANYAPGNASGRQEPEPRLRTPRNAGGR
jgi:membrane protease subunit HflK